MHVHEHSGAPPAFANKTQDYIIALQVTLTYIVEPPFFIAFSAYSSWLSRTF
jgi:hypothetical protein